MGCEARRSFENVEILSDGALRRGPQHRILPFRILPRDTKRNPYRRGEKISSFGALWKFKMSSTRMFLASMTMMTSPYGGVCGSNRCFRTLFELAASVNR
jgi:hypothetical protein